MSDLELVLDGQEQKNASLELLIKILAHQQAATDTLIDMLAETEQQADKFMKIYNERASRYAVTIFDHLYARRGTVDIKEILG